MNLLTNAIYETKELPMDKRYIIINVITSHEKIDINVIDNGGSVSADLEEDVFLPIKNYQAKRSWQWDGS